jgi:pilus assembly protein Flp/PilA
MNLINCLRALKRDTGGQDLLEYALLATLIALVVYGAVKSTGTSINTLFGGIATTIANAAGAGA